MGISDLILTILVLTSVACAIWILDLNPYGDQLQVYSQTCDNMILENTYCKGNWHNKPIEAFFINQETNQVIHKLANKTDSNIYKSCIIEDRKNWACTDEDSQQALSAKDGLLAYPENSDTRQISRLEWLQNKVLEKIN